MVKDPQQKQAPIFIQFDKTGATYDKDLNFDVDRSYNRDINSHHKLDDIDLEINNAENLDGPETMRNNGANTNRNKIQSTDNNA